MCYISILTFFIFNQPASESRTTASSFTTGNDGINVIEEPTGSPSIGIDTDGASILSTQPLYPELTMIQKVHQTRIVSDEPPRQSAQDVPSATDTIFRVNQAEPARIYRTQINPPADVLPFGPVVIKILYPMTANQAVRIRYPDPASTTTGDPAQISYSIKTPLYGNEDDLPVIDPSWITELEASQQDLPTREDETELGSHSTGKNTVEIPYSGISKMSGKKPKKVISEEERKRERAQNRLSSRRYRQRLRNEIEERKRELQMKRTVAILSKSSNERPESQSNNLQLYDNETGDFEDQSTVPDDDSGSQNEVI
ncbi:hypothetical protein RF11_06596 [Thelohanellus kitauei]|uniref:BZIP domain-containing protein n=1 Tax=Thelohanellus kitauei TaxID=669202 RepID=A0A0C2J6A6_THEKT|nr:hypothetical protein RF11_06596 [Thelohanellus kitauei]